ncbi:hypothetical protein ACN8ZM_39755 (plasmid) [Burkholderia aenigmatica]|uniref:hypothetical protein n=1 Tax=Burkholderia aenigmatica TaxID=2015348 RepID=UPI003B4303CE
MRKLPDNVTLSEAKMAAELDSINAAIDAFAAQMKATMARKVAENRVGWDDPALLPDIIDNLLAHGIQCPNDHRHAVHVGNFAMMVWYASEGRRQLGKAVATTA